MNVFRLVSAAGLLFVLCFFSFGVSAESSLPKLQIDRRAPLAMSVFFQGETYPLLLPSDFLKEVEGVYDDVYIEDLNDDGIGEVVFRLDGGGVNACSKVLHYKIADRSLAELDFGDGLLCNFKVRRGYIVSSYRDGAVWTENVYRIRNGEVEVEVSDSCVGCGEIKRKMYNLDGSFTRLLVSDDIDFERRVPLTAKVSSLRADIFSLPEISRRTNKYLIRGDKVALLDFFKDDNGEDWVEIRFSEVVSTEGWMKYSELELCDGC
ncbi:hypothetical protein [Pseudomonas fluorescens]|uniref:Uncharacterized protein n=1 Tax=Pseudomonas fluorescens TaxID=294 RepID=A0A5E6ZHW3_PSEFL|nr:hypothetical protein [Pseudomonas fluorescens]VVN65706.1 hypothetical protein PS723_00079 [Pseudomonas fluorescens]